MENGELNIMDTQKEEYLFLENSQQLFDFYGATCTKWANKFIYKKGFNEGDIIIYSQIEGSLNKNSFSKSDMNKLRKIYSFIN
jgi:hypothetical protein